MNQVDILRRNHESIEYRTRHSYTYQIQELSLKYKKYADAIKQEITINNEMKPKRSIANEGEEEKPKKSSKNVHEFQNANFTSCHQILQALIVSSTR